MIVEICGAPGAGKSTALPLVLELLAEAGYRARRPGEAIDERLARVGPARRLATVVRRLGRRGGGRRLLVDVPWSVLGMVSSPRATATAMVAIARNPIPLRHRALLLQRFLAPLSARRFLAGRVAPGEAVVFDEGLVHRAVNLFGWRGRRPGRAELQRYATGIPAPDVVVFLSARPAATRARLHRRGLPRKLRSQPVEVVDRFLDQAEAALRVVVDEMRARTTVVDVRNEGAVDELRQALRAALSIALDGNAGGARTPAPRTFSPSIPLELRRPDRWSSGRAARPAAAQRVDTVLEMYGLRRVGAARPVGRGRSANLLVPTDAGRVLLKRYKATVPEAAIGCEHAILAELARRGRPAPRLVGTPRGDTVVCIGGDRLALFEAVDGMIAAHERVSWPGEPSRIARLAGETLAGLHASLDGYWPEVLNPIGIGPDGRRILATPALLEELERAIVDADAAPDDLLHARDGIRRRLGELDAALLERRPSVSIVHGDYGPYNLLLRPGDPILPIDFELSRPDWRLVDLVTAIPRFARSRLGFHAGRARAFLAGYGSGPRNLPVADLRLLPAVAEFLALRRVVVCWTRWAATGDPAMLAEGRRRLRDARSLGAGVDPLVELVA